MVFVCHEEQFPGGVRGSSHGEANDKCITLKHRISSLSRH